MIDKATAARLVSTWFGSGNLPIAPGTMGALATLPLQVLLRALGPGAYLGTTVALTVLGAWAANHTAHELGEEDPQQIVIDEVVGTLIAMGFVRRGSVARQLWAFFLFRVFDIVKPGPIDTAQRAKPWGVGIMADDVLAGLAAGVVARFLPPYFR